MHPNRPVAGGTAYGTGRPLRSYATGHCAPCTNGGRHGLEALERVAHGRLFLPSVLAGQTDDQQGYSCSHWPESQASIAREVHLGASRRGRT
jgi:hypothetical protein